MFDHFPVVGFAVSLNMMASQKLANCCAAAIASLLRRT
jgi:mannose/fructose/N-acetylgalactosamine-specific phosphotransferase system component IIC